MKRWSDEIQREGCPADYARENVGRYQTSESREDTRKQIADAATYFFLLSM